MSIEREILAYLSKYKNQRVLRNRGVRIGFLGLPDFKYYKYQTLANRFSGLKHKGFVKEVDGVYKITHKGEQFLNTKEKNFFKSFTSKKTKNDPKNLLVIYDIPQEKTTVRNWFRKELKKFHFIMIQRSVWVGPGPLPEEFLRYVKEVKIGNDFKTFKLEKGYSGNQK